MEVGDIKKTYMEQTTFNGKEFDNNDLKSALENNTNDVVSNQGDSGISQTKMGRKMSPLEKKYLVRAENFDRDEENPMYDEADTTWSQPENYKE